VPDFKCLEQVEYKSSRSYRDAKKKMRRLAKQGFSKPYRGE